MEAHDIIGPWSEIKIEIISKYAATYSKILASRDFRHCYIDAFAGSGHNISSESGDRIPNCALEALHVEPPFQKYYFIDIDVHKVTSLEESVRDRTDVVVYHGDCNELLLDEVLPRVRYEEFRRGLCLLDPYGLHLNWEAIETAGTLGTIELFVNFPLHDMNRNVLWHEPERVSRAQTERMTEFWGDDSWKEIAYENNPQLSLFPERTKRVKASNDVVVDNFCERLKEVAGFKHVSKPVLFRNSRNAPLYYLLHATQKPVAKEIVEDILNKYREQGVVE